MEPEDWPRVKAIFDSVVLINKDKRSSYLRQACEDDAELRREVEGLLASFDAAEGFMEKPLAGEIADMFAVREPDELEPGQVFNRYKIIREIGAGGMGKVYLAEDTELRRRVAIKLLSAAATADADQVARFIQEARLASLLNHPNVLTIYEIGRTGDLHFISTEYVAGETLRDRMAREHLSSIDAIDIAIDVASALVVAHEADIVHRDIKPENIMLRDDGLLKVLDFGLAKLSGNERAVPGQTTDTWEDVKTAPGLILGTVSYMSPEQASGSDVDARTDIWSLGVVLYEMMTGRAPFKAAARTKIIESILKRDPTPITHDSADLQRHLRTIIRRSLAKDPVERYQSIREMLDDLKSFRSEVETGAVEPRSVAILPFVNITGDPGVSFFEFALADAVITELARSQSLVVRPSSSVAKYLGEKVDPVAIGKELKVDAVLAANFLLSKERIRVTTQLIDVGDRIVLWSEQIDSSTDDIIGLQDTITDRIVDGLKCELEPSTRPTISLPATGNSLAYTEYLRGRDQLRRYMFNTVANENVEIATRHFRRAIDLDPKFALAHGALGTCYLQKVIKVVGCREDVEIAAAELDHALMLDPQLIDARSYRAFVTRLQGETQKSRDEMARLRREAPNNFEVQYLSAACYRFDGDYESSFRSFEEMLRIDPTAQVAVHYCRARLFWFRAQFGLAFKELDLARAIEPNHPVVKFFHAVVTFRTGDPAAAAEELRGLFATNPCKGFRPYLAICLAALGEREAALRELTEEGERIAEVDPDVSYWLATANLLAERIDEALKWLKCSIHLGNHNLPWLETDPIWEPMRVDPRYTALLSSIPRRI